MKKIIAIYLMMISFHASSEGYFDIEGVRLGMNYDEVMYVLRTIHGATTQKRKKSHNSIFDKLSSGKKSKNVITNNAAKSNGQIRADLNGDVISITSSENPFKVDFVAMSYKRTTDIKQHHYMQVTKYVQKYGNYHYTSNGTNPNHFWCVDSTCANIKQKGIEKLGIRQGRVVLTNKH